MDDIKKFGSKLKIRVSPKDKDLLEKNIFIKSINILEFCVERGNNFLELGFDIENIEEPYLDVIELLFGLHFGGWTAELVEWYLFDRIDEDGEIYPLVLSEDEEDEGEKIMIKNPEEFWDIIQKIKNKINKKEND
jgi:hypothetical protein